MYSYLIRILQTTVQGNMDETMYASGPVNYEQQVCLFAIALTLWNIPLPEIRMALSLLAFHKNIKTWCPGCITWLLGILIFAFNSSIHDITFYSVCCLLSRVTCGSGQLYKLIK